MYIPDPEFWDGRRVLVTGHTGFKGSWLTLWLQSLGSRVHGVSLPEPPSDPSLWEQMHLSAVSETRADIVSEGWQAAARTFDPEIVFHLAAQPLVVEGYRLPAATFRTNVQGTVALLGLLSDLRSLMATVVVTTDKVYDVRQRPPFVESAHLGGTDPYSASKSAAELVVHSWPDQRRLVTARAGNVVGGGDWAAGRILPDIVRAWSKTETLVLRMPKAVRPWQHVVEPLAGYLAYAEALAVGAELPRALNFGPSASQAVAVEDVADYAASEWRRLVPGAAPTWRAEPRPSMEETAVLTLDSGLARESLGWAGKWDWREAVSRSIEWYVMVGAGADPKALSASQIRQYCLG